MGPVNNVVDVAISINEGISAVIVWVVENHRIIVLEVAVELVDELGKVAFEAPGKLYAQDE